MKQLGNLAIVCAKRPEVLMQIHGGIVTVHVGRNEPACILLGTMTQGYPISSMSSTSENTVR